MKNSYYIYLFFILSIIFFIYSYYKYIKNNIDFDFNFGDIDFQDMINESQQYQNKKDNLIFKNIPLKIKIINKTPISFKISNLDLVIIHNNTDVIFSKYHSDIYLKKNSINEFDIKIDIILSPQLLNSFFEKYILKKIKKIIFDYVIKFYFLGMNLKIKNNYIYE